VTPEEAKAAVEQVMGTIQPEPNGAASPIRSPQSDMG
jgi:hypothetical protein